MADDTDAFAIADLGDVWIDLDIFQEQLDLVREGQAVKITSTSGNLHASGTIRFVRSTLGEETRTAVARIVLENENRRWRPGMFVNGEVVVEQSEVDVLVEWSAVIADDEHDVVFVRDGNEFAAREVVLGRSNDTHVEVLSGLSTGDMYLSKGAFTLKAEMGKNCPFRRSFSVNTGVSIMKNIVEIPLKNRVLVFVFAVGVLIAGWTSYSGLPVDAFPDVSPSLVQVFTVTEGLAPEEIEQYVTYPIEAVMNGLPQLEKVRSVSNFGLSVVNVYFEEGTDMYFAPTGGRGATERSQRADSGRIWRAGNGTDFDRHGIGPVLLPRRHNWLVLP